MGAGSVTADASNCEPGARHEQLTLAAYHKGLDELGPYRRNRPLLLERLGDVDQQATNPATDARLVLAGRLIAAAQLAEPAQLPESQVHGVVRAWLAIREPERDDAAPAPTHRAAFGDERIRGLNRLLADAECAAGFSRAAWAIAGTVLQHLIRPTVEVARALGLRATLDPLADAALALIEEPPPWSTVDDPLHRLLTAIAIRVRALGLVVTNPAAGVGERRAAWIEIAGAAGCAHAHWSGFPDERSMAHVLERATERAAASRVPDQPERFSHEAAVEHAVQAAFDAAVAALGLAIRPAEPVFVDAEQEVGEGLREAGSSALIGAWVIDRATR